MPQRERKLSTHQVIDKLQTINLDLLPPAKNKGSRGQLIETMLDIDNSSSLLDLLDGEIKSFTIGQSIAVTQLRHCLPEIIDNNAVYDSSKVAKKLAQVIYIGFNKSGVCKGFKLINPIIDIHHHTMIEQDYNSICSYVINMYHSNSLMHTFTGPNGLLQIRTKARKRSDGTYSPLTFNDVLLSNKGMAFYFTGSFGKSLFTN